MSLGSGLYKPLLNFCKIDDQIAVIDPHRNLIVESIRMRLVTFFKEITQDRFCLRIYNPIFTYAGILVFHTFLFPSHPPRRHKRKDTARTPAEIPSAFHAAGKDPRFLTTQEPRSEKQEVPVKLPPSGLPCSIFVLQKAALLIRIYKNSRKSG